MTAEATKLGVGVIGLGVGEQHARMFARLPECRLNWLCDHNLEKAQRLAQELSGACATTEYADILRSAETSIVALATFDHCHAQEIIDALSVGKHVFVEKPLCTTEGELRAVKKAWEAHQGACKLTSNLILRAAPLYQWLRESIAAGEFGEIYSIDGEYLFGRIEKITQGWRKDMPDFSVMESGGVHMIDLVLWLTGQRPTSVVASGNNLSTRGSAFHYNDFVTSILQFDSGLVGRITANFGCVHRHHHVLRIYGTKATFLYDDAGARIHRSRDPQQSAQPITHPALPSHKGDLIPPLVKAIIENRDISAETQTYLDGIAIAISCDKSEKEKMTIPVNYV